MKDTFDLRKHLLENKLTNRAKALSEAKEDFYSSRSADGASYYPHRLNKRMDLFNGFIEVFSNDINCIL